MTKRVDLSDLSCLVLDDSALMVSLLGSVLLAFGIRKIIRAREGVTAIRAVFEGRVDLAIVDRHLEHENGLDFVRAVRTRQFSPSPQIPVIVLSAHTSRRAISEALLAGANDMLCKPVSVRTLYGHIVDAVLRPRHFAQCGPLVLPLPRGMSSAMADQLSPEAFRRAVAASAEGRADPVQTSVQHTQMLTDLLPA